MDVLFRILSTNPDMKLANLDAFIGLSDNLNQVLPTLAKLEQLEEMSLRRNSLSSLPQDMSMLKGVKRLDMSKNKIESINDVIDGLKSLPSLEELKIDLPDENDKYILVKQLGSLKYLNEEEIVYTPKASPKASKTFNSEILKTPPSPKIRFQEDDIHFSTELESIEEIFHQIRVLHRMKSPTYENTLINLFEHQVSKANEEIKKYRSGSSTDNIMKTHVINAKFALYDMCMDKVIEYVQGVDPRLSNILQSINSSTQELQSDLSGIVLGKLPRLEHSLLAVKEELEISKQETSELNQLVQRLENANSKAVHDLMGETKPLRTINTESSARAFSPHHQTMPTENQPRAFSPRHQTMPTESPPRASSPRHQRTESEFISKDYDIIERPISPQLPSRSADYSHLNLDIEKNAYSPKPSSPQIPNPTADETSLHLDLQNKRYSTGRLGSTLNSTARSDSKGSPRKYYTRPNSPTKMSDITTDSGKLLSLKQLKDVIAEIYASKANYDAKCKENRLPRETLEQHMFSYINNKYGLLKLQVKQLSTLLNSIEKYRNVDSEVALFSKQVENKIEEKFLWHHHQLKQNFGAAVQRLLQNLYPFKSDVEIRGIFQHNFDQLVFGQKEWTEIVRQIFNEKDTQDLIGIIRRHQLLISERSHSPCGVKKPTARRLSRKEQQEKEEYEQFQKSRIACGDLLQIMLDFQLQGHERFLSNFCTLFRELDTDSDGVLTEGQFVDLMYSLKFGFSENQIERFLRMVDTNGNGQTTFTEIVDLLEKEQIEVNDVRMSVLTYCALE